MNLGSENELQEFKEGLGQLEKGLKSLTAMLNRSGKGSVYFGVGDNGDVLGLTVGKDTLMNIRSRVRDLVEPQILANIEDCRDEDGRHYIRVSAIGTDIPYSCDGRYYIRNVSADERVSNDLLRKMLVVGESDLIRRIESDRGQLTFRQLFTILAEKKVHVSDTDAFYRNYGLVDCAGKFTFLGYLLSDQNETSMKVVRFDGLDKSAMSERTEYGGKCLLLSVFEVLERMKSHNVMRVELSEGVRRETPLFSYEAFREAWINACLHNKWADRLPPSVFLFDDRVEVMSYGGLPFGLTEESFFGGTSMPVNRSLLTLFIVAGMAEQSGHGVPIIVSECGRDAFGIDNASITVRIKYNYEPETVRERRLRVSPQLDDNQRLVLEYLGKNPRAKLQAVADDLGLSLSGVKKIIARLQGSGLILREGSRRSGRWRRN